MGQGRSRAQVSEGYLETDRRLKSNPQVGSSCRRNTSMSGTLCDRWVGLAVAMIAVLLPAGILAAATVGPPVRDPDRRVSAAALAQESLAENDAIGPAIVTTTVAPMPPAQSTAIGPPTAPTTTAKLKPAVTPTTTTTPLAGVPRPALAPVPNPNPPTSSWTNTTGDVTARMRMEPATPLPGQPVHFYVEVMAPSACCAVNLSYGDGTMAPIPPAGCEFPRARTFTFTHTFAAAGSYELLLVNSTFPCDPKMVDGRFIESPIYGSSIQTCIGVGLAAPSRPACEPFVHFGPGTAVSDR